MYNEILFFFLAAATVISALFVILSKNPVHSLLALIVTFFTISGHYIFLNAQFLAIVNIIVYAGAIMVLFLFVIMLMNLNAETEPQKQLLIKMLGIIGGGTLFLLLVFILKKQPQEQFPLQLNAHIGLVKNLGLQLFQDYVIPFELTGLLFLTAIIAAVLLAKKEDSPL